MDKNISKEELKKLVQESNTIIEVFTKLKLNNLSSSNHYRIFRSLTTKYNIDCSHFKSGNRKNGTFITKRNIEDYLSNKFTIQSNKLKKRLLLEGIFEHQCVSCKNTTWMELPIPLQLDHIDGNPNNNNLTNLRLLCPNCHSQTDTYCGKNIKKGKKDNNPSPKKKKDKIIKEPYIRTKKCNLTDYEIYEIFLSNNNNYSKTGKQLGISDNAIRKRIKNIIGGNSRTRTDTD